MHNLQLSFVSRPTRAVERWISRFRDLSLIAGVCLIGLTLGGLPTIASAQALGDTNVEPAMDNDAAGMAEAFRVIASSSETVNTLKVYVDGLQWTEVPTFYGHDSKDEIYIVRQNDKNESQVTFGDGVLGRRLNTGAVVVAYYRFGGGGAMPPAGSITQIAKPVKGLKSVRSPVAAYGGADEEAARRDRRARARRRGGGATRFGLR